MQENKYIIIGHDSGRKTVLGLGEDPNKEELLVYCQKMFVDYSEIELLLSIKASEEENSLARQGTIITREWVII